jgi:hypothetical protein
MQNMPLYISILFIISVAYTVYSFWNASKRYKITLPVILAWLTLQGILAFSGFYLDTKGTPPKFVLAIAPALIAIVLLFITKKGRMFIDKFDIIQLSLLHVVRIPVEIVLYWLCLYKAVPHVITFEGQNFDILSGITAPLAWYMAKRYRNTTFLLAWNIICLALLLNVVVTAILAAPFDFQQIAFNQPTIAILYFPFVWLPACVVPLVLFSHLIAIRQLIIKRQTVFVVAH